LQSSRDFGSLVAVRSHLALCLLLTSIASLRAQEQEGKLVDRLLRPNMALQSSEQNKKFSADRVGATKHANVKTLYLQKKDNSKTFTNTRDFSAQPYNSWAFNASGNHTNKISQERKASVKTYATTMARTPVKLRDADKTEESRDYPGNRPYLEQGKSQKSLDRHNDPMTIEQVRELLNKNK
jgi:hypothetical protein